MTDLTKESFYNLLKMLCSEDEENMLVGLKCIDQLDLERNLLFIVLLKKLGHVTHKTWTEEAPLTTARLKQITHPEAIHYMPYTEIMSTFGYMPKLHKDSLIVFAEWATRMLEQKLILMNAEQMKGLKILIEFKDGD